MRLHVNNNESFVAGHYNWGRRESWWQQANNTIRYRYDKVYLLWILPGSMSCWCHSWGKFYFHILKVSCLIAISINIIMTRPTSKGYSCNSRIAFYKNNRHDLPINLWCHLQSSPMLANYPKQSWNKLFLDAVELRRCVLGNFLKVFFNLGNSKKSQVARSGKYGGGWPLEC